MNNQLLFKKVIDWSCLNYGFTIPLKSHQKFQDYNNKYIPRGIHQEINLIYKNQKFKGIIRNVDRKKVKNDTLQLLYSADSKFLNLLRKEFHSTYEYVMSKRAFAIKEGKKKPNIKIPKELSEHLEIYGTGNPFEFKIQLITQKGEDIEPKKINDLKKEIKILESKRISFPCIPDLFSDLIKISFGKIKKEKYRNIVHSTLFEDLVFLAFKTLGYDEAKQLGYKASAVTK